MIPNSVVKITSSLQPDKNSDYFTWRSVYFFWSYLTQFFL